MARGFRGETYSGDRTAWPNSFYYTPVDTLPLHPDSATWVTDTEAIHMSATIPRDYVEVRPYTLANWNQTIYWFPTRNGQPAGFYSEYDSSYFVDRVDGAALTTWDLSAGGELSPSTSNRWSTEVRPENAFGSGTATSVYENLTSGDRHTIMWDETNDVLVESTGYTTVGGQPWAENVVSWDTTTYTLPAGATNNLDPGVVAARIPLGPLMFTYNDLTAVSSGTVEGATGTLGHMVGWVAHDYRDEHEWPARWKDGDQIIGPPCGAVMRLKADFDHTQFASPQMRAFARTLKKHGAILFDRNLNTPVFAMMNDANWFNMNSSAFKFTDFEFVDMSDLKVANDSIQAGAAPPPPPTTYTGALDALAARIAAL